MRWLMNFKESGERIYRMEKRLRNDHSEAKWPKGFFDFTPIEDVPDFKVFGKELKDNVSEDPLERKARQFLLPLFREITSL